ncbi:hypothetical protein [Streptomyces sp. 8L]|uniref:hypothetical protein n=1 Tax=Streptomyces sp. 8L TaxID=2877242 RepID=UPI001CD46B68|nr:hypothetical protein [Streptomyces sp. 8L]MCA1218700.1 hypothetical protein [Streptomyces sp. 8L]
MSDDSVTLTHPTLPGSRYTTTRQQAEQVWKARGWQPAPDAPETVAVSAAATDPAPARAKTDTTGPAASSAANTSKEN